MDRPTGPARGVGRALLAKTSRGATRSGLITFDASGHITGWDAQAAEVLHVVDDALAGRPIRECGLVVYTRRARIVDEFDDPGVRCVLHGTPSNDVDLGLVAIDGSRSWFGISVVPMFGAVGAVVGALAVVRDTTQTVESERAEMRARMSPGEHRGVAVASMVVGDDQRVVRWNAQACDELGLDAHDLAACRLGDICDVDLHWVRARLAASPELVRGRVILRHRAGDRLVARAAFGRSDEVGELAMRFVLDADPVIAPRGGRKHRRAW